MLATSCMSLVITVCVLQMYHTDPQTVVPHWIRVMVECMGAATLQKKSLQKFRLAMPSVGKPEKNGPIGNGYQYAVNETSIFNVGVKELVENEKSKNNVNEFDNSVVSILKEQNKILKDILASNKQKSSNAEDVVSDNLIAWRVASEIIDNFFVVLFFIIIIVVNILMLVVMPQVKRYFE